MSNTCIMHRKRTIPHLMMKNVMLHRPGMSNRQKYDRRHITHQCRDDALLPARSFFASDVRDDQSQYLLLVVCCINVVCSMSICWTTSCWFVCCRRWSAWTLMDSRSSCCHQHNRLYWILTHHRRSLYSFRIHRQISFRSNSVLCPR